MGLKAYLLIRANDELDQERFAKELLELEAMSEVDFVDPVVGNYDAVAMVEAPVSVDIVAKKLESLDWVKETEILRIAGVFERHRASMREIPKVVKHSGL